MNNLCILSFCFENTDEEKIVLNISLAGDRQAEKLSPERLWERNQVLYKIGQSIWLQEQFMCLALVPFMNDHIIIR